MTGLFFLNKNIKQASQIIRVRFFFLNPHIWKLKSWWRLFWSDNRLWCEAQNHLGCQDANIFLLQWVAASLYLFKALGWKINSSQGFGFSLRLEFKGQNSFSFSSSYQVSKGLCVHCFMTFTGLWVSVEEMKEASHLIFSGSQRCMLYTKVLTQGWEISKVRVLLMMANSSRTASI